ncbi:MAG: SatD family protein [Halobacteriales archaeon]
MVTRTVLLGDVVGSLQIDDRAAFQGLIRGALATANETDTVEAPFVLQKGIDEFAGVLSTPEGVYEAVRTIQERIRPQTARFAIVHGEVDVGSERMDARAMDGPAFHRGDELLEEAA